MHLGIHRLRALPSRPALILVAAAIASIAIIACRGGGAAPSGPPTIPVIQPTVGPSECANDIYPATAPQFQSEADLTLSTTGSGLRYMVVQPGDGPKPNANSPVVTRYTGWLADGGCVIDSTFLRTRDTTTFGLNQPLIQGWKEALLDMAAGEKRMVVIPADLAYGALGAAPRVPPNAKLIYYVELVEILEPAQATATVDAVITATADARATAQSNAEATATAFSGSLPPTPTATPLP